MTAALACLLILAGPALYRSPEHSPARRSLNGPTWVYFTDKGIAGEAEYARALDVLDRQADVDRLERRRREPVGGFDFDDLPVRGEYVRRVEALGGRLRTVSRWLNAASFDLPEPAFEQVAALPFVYDIRPVAARAEHIAPALRLEPDRGVRSRAVDTAEAHRFYGPSYDQAQMMGVPDLFFRGYYGSGVRLAMFDSGLKLHNVAVRNLRIRRQHDFLSGDHFHSATSGSAWNPVAAESLRFLGLVKSPALFRSRDAANVFLAFVADSFSYSGSPARRAIFASRLDPVTASWTQPVPVVLSQNATQFTVETFDNLRFAGRGFVSYLAYNNLLSGNRTRPTTNVYVGYFVGADWVGSSRVGPGWCPDVAVVDDTLFLAMVDNDSTITVRKASVVMAEPEWVAAAVIRTDEAVRALRMAVDEQARVVIVAEGRTGARLACYRSADRGATFGPAVELAASQARDPRLAQAGPDLMLSFTDAGESPFTRLAVRYSDDHGASWTARPPAAESTLSVGGHDLAIADSDVTLVYESGGILYRTGSPDFGASWRPASVLDTAGFCDMPALLATDAGVTAAWIKRGDDNVDVEPADSAKFSQDQADHGTRMASIIAGYQQGSIVGVAPGVDLLVAKTELHKTASGRYYEYNMEEDTYIEALEWAEANGADIVSTSLGYRGWYADDQFDGKTAPISVAASLAAARGLIVVTAMGNRDTLVYPWPEPFITAPADAEGVIAAGGVERNLLPWRGTGTGPTSDGRTKPDLVALCDTVAVAAPDSLDGLEGSVGTSCATALIAGAFALLKEAHPEWTAESLKAVLFSTATNAVKSCTFGYGVPQLDSAFALYPPDAGVVTVPEDRIGAIFPNPFTGEHDRVYFPLHLARPAPTARISIYTVSGTLIDTFELRTDAMSRPAHYSTIEELDDIGAWWDGMTMSGKPAVSGLYLAVYSSTFSRTTAKFALVR